MTQMTWNQEDGGRLNPGIRKHWFNPDGILEKITGKDAITSTPPNQCDKSTSDSDVKDQ